MLRTVECALYSRLERRISSSTTAAAHPVPSESLGKLEVFTEMRIVTLQAGNMDARVHHRGTTGSRQRQRSSRELCTTKVLKGGLRVNRKSVRPRKTRNEGYPGGSFRRRKPPSKRSTIGAPRNKEQKGPGGYERRKAAL